MERTGNKKKTFFIRIIKVQEKDKVKIVTNKICAKKTLTSYSKFL